MATSASFKNRYKKFVQYGGKEDAQPSDVALTGASILSDWNRYRKNTTPGVGYYIGDQPLSKLQSQDFENLDELRSFVKEHLFCKLEEKDITPELIDNALAHFNQGGIPTATYKTINQKNISSTETRKLNEPEFKITFTPTAQGVQITEVDTYKKWTDISGGKVQKHECGPEKPFYARTETKYLFTTTGDIKLLNCEVDCPSKNLAAIFDKPSLIERLLETIRAMFSSKKNEPLQEDKILFQSPQQGG